jgi:hypothetical protein
MRRRIVRAVAIAGLVTFASIAFAFSTGPPASRTGAPAVAGRPAEQLCVVCHSTNPPNNPLGLLEILDLPESYSPGQVYPMRIRLSFTGHPPEAQFKWGFQVTSVSGSTGRGVGTWLPSPGLKVIPATSPSFPGRWYIEHGDDPLTVHEGDPGPVEWQFSWQAPPGDSGAVYVFAAGNSANGDGTNQGDFIFTARDTMLAPTVTAVIPPFDIVCVNWLGNPTPNPFKQCVDLSFEIARAGPMDLSIYDVQGRAVRRIVHGWHESGPGAAFWDGRKNDGTLAANGVYFARLSAPDLRKPMVKRLTLAR